MRLMAMRRACVCGCFARLAARRGVSRTAAVGLASSFALLSLGCGDDAASPPERTTATPVRTAAPSGSAGAEAQERGGPGDLPFAFSLPKGFVRGRSTEQIVASVLLDRRNAILIRRFGHGEPTPEQLRDAIQSKVSAAARTERATLYDGPGFDFVVLDLSQFRTQVADQPVAGRRLFFSAGGAIWEVDCQYTREGRERVLKGCARVVSTLRPR